jgi:hypothetical protein
MPTPGGGLAARTTPSGGLAARTTPVGGIAAQTTPVGGIAAQSEPAIDLDDDLAIPVEGSRPPVSSFAGMIPLPPADAPGIDDAFAAPAPLASPAEAPMSAQPAPLGPPVDAPMSAQPAPFAPPADAPMSARPAPLGPPADAPMSAHPAPLAPPADAPVSAHPAPALPFAAPRADAGSAHFDDSTVPRPMPRASTDTTPLPPPPMSVVPPSVEHPRVPSEWMADRGDSRPVRAMGRPPARNDLTTDQVAPLARGRAAGSKKLVIIGGGAAVAALVLIIALTRGGSSKGPAHAATPATGSTVAIAEGAHGAAAAGEHADSPTTQPSHERHGAQRIAAVASGGSAEPQVGSDDALDATGSAHAGSDAGSAVAEPPPTPRRHPTLGGKQVVLEYDTQSHPAPVAAPREDSAAVAKARAAYANGNQHLFAGDAAGAVRAYQQALDDYPGYVAGYRGLGLAYSQAGDKAKALQAFHTYLANAPGAKDASLIRKRLKALMH